MNNTDNITLQSILTEPFILNGRQLFPDRVIPGPLEGISTPGLYNALLNKGLINSWIMPFIRISNNVPKSTFFNKQLSYYKLEQTPLIVQLLGDSPERMAESARRLTLCGATGVDLNFACPSPAVTRSGCGGALLNKPELMHRIIAGIRAASPDTILSVKLRVGIESEDEIYKIAETMQADKPDYIILHFRTVKEMYGDVSNPYERLRKAVEALSPIPVFASGNLFTIKDIYNTMQIPGIVGVAPARGFIKNPWLLKNALNSTANQPIHEPTNADLLSLLKEIYIESAKIIDIKNSIRPMLKLSAMILQPSNPAFRQLTLIKTCDEAIAFLNNQLTIDN